MTYKFKTLVMAICLQQACFAQTPDEIRQIFPGTDFVYQNYNQDLELYIKNDMPVAESKSNIDMIMLGDKNSNMLSRYSVYHSDFHELKSLDAYTRVPVGNKFKNVKVTDTKIVGRYDSDVFYDDVKETTFDFPALTQNAIAHVDYTQFHKDVHLLSAFYLPSYGPTLNAAYTVTVPNDISIKFIVKNDSKGKFQFTEEKKRNETVYKWVMNNFKPEDVYSNAPDMRYFQPHIIVYVTSYENKTGKHAFLDNLDDLHNWNYSFISNLNSSPDPQLKKIVDSLTTDKMSEHDKAQKIYRWVQQHIKYVAFENGLEGFRPRQAAEVCSKRYGDCKDMSSIITQMLRIAGIKAYYTWIGTRDIPYTYTEIPLPIVDNHMISTALINGNWMFFDGTDPNARFDMPPAFIQGKEALVSINEKEYKVLTVPVAQPEKSVIIDSTFISLDDNGINGCESVSYNGYFGKEIYTALLYRDENETKEYVKKKMSKGSNKFTLGKYSIARINSDENLANITADFTLPGYGKKVGSEYFINLNLEKIFENQVIDTLKRKVPWEVDFNYNIRQYHILEIPKGYTVSYLPKDFRFENDLIKIDMYYKIENDKVIAAQEVKNKKLLINPPDFEEWNKPMKAVQPFYKESVVLEKK